VEPVVEELSAAAASEHLAASEALQLLALEARHHPLPKVVGLPGEACQLQVIQKLEAAEAYRIQTEP